jgi:acetylornithine deacetylase
MKPDNITSAAGLLAELVRIPSVNQFITGKKEAEAGVASFLKDFASGIGFDARLLAVAGCAPDLLITKEFKKGAPWLMFAAHMDTVSAEGMDFGPFSGLEKDGRIFGRGACDDKGCIAASMWALKEIAEQGGSKTNIAILCTVDEEQQRHGATAFSNTHFAALGFKPAGVIVAEPTSLKPIVAHAGIGHFSIKTSGIAAHASTPSKGRSAIKDMVRVIDALEKGYISRLSATDPLCGKAQCSINMIHGGRQVNAIPDECIIQVDRRVMPGEDAASIIPGVEKVLDELRQADPSLKVQVLPGFTDRPLKQDLNHPFIKKVLGCIGGMGLDAAPKGAAFATDAGELSRTIPACVVLGPGDDSLAHTAKESIAAGEIESGVRLYKKLMEEEWKDD